MWCLTCWDDYVTTTNQSPWSHWLVSLSQYSTFLGTLCYPWLLSLTWLYFFDSLASIESLLNLNSNVMIQIRCVFFFFKSYLPNNFGVEWCSMACISLIVRAIWWRYSFTRRISSCMIEKPLSKSNLSKDIKVYQLLEAHHNDVT